MNNETNNEKLLIELVRNLCAEVAELKEQVRFSGKPTYSNQEAMELFGIGTATLKKWRDEGLLGFSKIGSVYEYSSQDIAKFMANTHDKYSGYAFND